MSDPRDLDSQVSGTKPLTQAVALELLQERVRALSEICMKVVETTDLPGRAQLLSRLAVIVHEGPDGS